MRIHNFAFPCRFAFDHVADARRNKQLNAAYRVIVLIFCIVFSSKTLLQTNVVLSSCMKVKKFPVESPGGISRWMESPGGISRWNLPVESPGGISRWNFPVESDRIAERLSICTRFTNLIESRHDIRIQMCKVPKVPTCTAVAAPAPPFMSGLALEPADVQLQVQLHVPL